MLGGDVVLNGDGELGEVVEADDLAELLLSFEHAGGGPPEAHVAVLPALDVAAGAADGLDVGSAARRRVALAPGGCPALPRLRAALCSPPPSEPDVRVPTHPALRRVGRCSFRVLVRQWRCPS